MGNLKSKKKNLSKYSVTLRESEVAEFFNGTWYDINSGDVMMFDFSYNSVENSIRISTTYSNTNTVTKFGIYKDGVLTTNDNNNYYVMLFDKKDNVGLLCTNWSRHIICKNEYITLKDLLNLRGILRAYEIIKMIDKRI